MALGGVETGNLNPKLPTRHAPRPGGRGLTPEVWAMAIITGIPILAEAVAAVLESHMYKAAEISPMADNIRSNLTSAPFSFPSTLI